MQDKSGKISRAELREVCIQFNLPVEPELLEALVTYCDVDGDGQINYEEFANFLNWKGKMPSGVMPKHFEGRISRGKEEKVRKGIISSINIIIIIISIIYLSNITSSFIYQILHHL